MPGTTSDGEHQRAPDARTGRGRLSGDRQSTISEQSLPTSESLAHNLLKTPPTAPRLAVGGVASAATGEPAPPETRRNRWRPRRLTANSKGYHRMEPQYWVAPATAEPV